MNKKHPIPEKYHALFAIGEKDRRGNVIDFKIPPVIIDSLLTMDNHKKIIFDEHISIESLSMEYNKFRQFIILRPTALFYINYIKEEIKKSGLYIEEEFKLHNFMKFADVIYSLDPKISFHWKWRVIMKLLHETHFQNQNKAIVFILKNQYNNDTIVIDIKKRIRNAMGEIPVLIRYSGKPEIALGIHHIHSPDFEKLAVEYNVLMHAKLKTSVFATNPY